MEQHDADMKLMRGATSAWPATTGTGVALAGLPVISNLQSSGMEAFPGLLSLGCHSDVTLDDVMRHFLLNENSKKWNKKKKSRANKKGSLGLGHCSDI